MMNKTDVKTRTSRGKHIAFGLCMAAFAVLLYIVPPVTEAIPLAGAVLGAAMIAAMAVCVFKGGLTSVESTENTR